MNWKRFFCSILAAVVSFIWLSVSSSALAKQSDDWAGEWQTYWREGQALMILSQEGDQVMGTFEPQGGLVEGRVDGRLLRGRWQVDQASGGLIFALSPDGQAFTGRYDSGEYWNGRRIAEDQVHDSSFSAAISPRETLRTVITASNEVIFSGNAAAMQTYEPLLVYEGAGADTRDHNRRRRLLWLLLNMSTFRIYDAPARPKGETAVFEISPTDSSFHYPLRFRRSKAGRWLLIVESEERLKMAIDLFLNDLGYESIEAMQDARRRSPRATVHAFLDGVSNWDKGGAKKALATFDLSFAPEYLHATEGPILADYLRQIFDRIGYVIWQEIPDNPSRPTPYVHYRHPAGNVTIQRVQEGDSDAYRWLFSAETLKAVPEIFAAIQNLPLAPGIAKSEPLTEFFRIREAVRTVSPKLLHRTVILENWQWLALLLAAASLAIAGWAAGRITYAVIFRVLRHTESNVTEEDDVDSLKVNKGPGTEAERDTEADAPLPTNELTDNDNLPDIKARAFAWPVSISVAGILLIQGLEFVGIVQTVFNKLYQAASLITAFGVTLVVFQAVGLLGHWAIRRAETTPSYVDEIMTSLATGLAKVIVVAAGIVACANIIDLPYEGVITGLGIGGVALAFASRETVSNMLGGALLMTDRPFKRGDLLETDGHHATVVNVGLRSTRMRRLDDTVMIIPNAQLSDKAIINWGVRQRRRIDLSIGLTYSTPRQKLDAFVQRLKAHFTEMPEADPENCYVGLKDFGASAIEIEFRGFVRVFSYEDQVRVRHALIGDVIDLAEETGVSFAYPTRTVHILNAIPGCETGKEGQTDSVPG